MERQSLSLLQDLSYPSETAAIDAILTIGIELAPEEACGILVKENKHSWRVVQLQNRAEDRTIGYVIDPKTVAQIVEKPEVWYERTQVWHTHPRGTVGPSEMDMKTKHDDVRYLVVTVPTGEYRRF